MGTACSLQKCNYQRLVHTLFIYSLKVSFSFKNSLRNTHKLCNTLIVKLCNTLIVLLTFRNIRDKLIKWSYVSNSVVGSFTVMEMLCFINCFVKLIYYSSNLMLIISFSEQAAFGENWCIDILLPD